MAISEHANIPSRPIDSYKAVGKYLGSVLIQVDLKFLNQFGKKISLSTVFNTARTSETHLRCLWISANDMLGVEAWRLVTCEGMSDIIEFARTLKNGIHISKHSQIALRQGSSTSLAKVAVLELIESRW